MGNFNKRDYLHPENMAEIIINNCIDMHNFMECEDIERAKSDIYECLDHIATICENDLNMDYWRTFYAALSELLNNLDK